MEQRSRVKYPHNQQTASKHDNKLMIIIKGYLQNNNNHLLEKQVPGIYMGLSIAYVKFSYWFQTKKKLKT